MNVRKPIAYLCQCSQETNTIERLLDLGGFSAQPNLSLPAIVQLMSELPGEPADLIVCSVQEGGLAVAQMIHQMDMAPKPRVVLIDFTGDVQAAMKAIRLHAADYLLISEGTDKLAERFMNLAQLIEKEDEQLAAVPSDLMHAGMLQPVMAGMGHHANGNGHGFGTAVAHVPHNVWWDASLCAIRSDDMWVPLSPIEWKLFETLVNKRGSVVSTEDLILTALARTGTTASDTSLLRLHVSRLRAKLSEHFSHELSIVTMRGRGYMLV